MRKHTCDNMDKYCEISYDVFGDKKWSIQEEIDNGYIDILFCPFCGKELFNE